MASVHTFRQRRRRLGALPIIVAILLFIIAGHVFLDELYRVRLHQSLGYGSIYTKNLWFQIISRYAGALLYAWLAWWVARPLQNVLPRLPYQTLNVVVAFVGWMIGYSVWALDATSWYLFFHHASFHHFDPLFHFDLSFYTYDLPILQGLAGRLIATLILWLIGRTLAFGATLIQQNSVTTNLSAAHIHGQLRRLLTWLAVLFFLFAAVAVLNRYAIALWPGTEQFLHGPDFATVHITVPIVSWIRILAWLFVTGAVIWMAIRVDRVFPVQDGFVRLTARPFKWPIVSVGVWLAVIILSGIVNQLINGLYVRPNQNTVELPYIQRTIDETRYAIGINRVNIKPFTPTDVLTTASVTRDQNAITNVRINDQNQTTDIYNQLQSFKSYFQFDGASVDRYKSSEVYISPREMNVNKLPVQTWINQTLVYTHGYGVAASPVNAFDQQGLPVLWALNTPQMTVAPIPKITEPRIYFGMQGNDVIAPSKQGEFDYPSGSSDAISHYQGGYGLPVRGNRLLLTIEQGTLRYFTTDQLVPQSQYLFDRNIYQRIADIMPFLTIDHDAFPFINDQGHIEWMVDAYTSTANVPYAQTFMNGTAYIRNSVKVVVDAYTGKVTFYVVDSADPMLKSLEQVYPGAFTVMIPSDVRAHFRYPMDLFQAQSNALTRYHMTNANAFYNQEDQWAIANQIYQQNNVEQRPPVYQMIRMPDQLSPQFVLSSLFTPVSKDNLNGWLVADNQPNDYGALSLYQFTQSKLIFGPMQAENQIDADPSLSAQLSLWNQQGSQVIRGDLLMVPIGNAMLYVEPIYLVASRQNSLPQLERVVIDFNQQVYVNNTMNAALRDLLQTTGAASSTSAGGGTGQLGVGNGAGGNVGPGATNGGQPQGGGLGQVGQTMNQATLIRQASQLFAKYESDTAKGDFASAGKALQALGVVLRQLNGQR